MLCFLAPALRFCRGSRNMLAVRHSISSDRYVSGSLSCCVNRQGILLKSHQSWKRIEFKCVCSAHEHVVLDFEQERNSARSSPNSDLCPSNTVSRPNRDKRISLEPSLSHHLSCLSRRANEDLLDQRR